jgi:hypothetical protein
MSADSLAESLDRMTLRITLPSDIEPQLDDDALVAGLVGRETLVAIVGASNSGKSAIALDLATCVATGQPFRDRRVAQSAVLYLACEGGNGFRNRVSALLKNKRLTLDAPLGVVCDTLDLCQNRTDVDRVIAATATLQGRTRKKVGMIVIDTLNRVLGGGDENSAVDMARLIRHLDLIRTQTEATVALIHHTGKDATRGARGHSSLRAALDTELLVEGATNPRTVSSTKQRDYAPVDSFSVNLVPITLGSNQHGESVTSIAVEHLDTPPTKRLNGLGKNQSAAIAGLREWAAAHPDPFITTQELTDLLKRHAIVNRQRRLDTTNFLVNSGVLTKSIGGYSFERGVL